MLDDCFRVCAELPPISHVSNVCCGLLPNIINGSHPQLLNFVLFDAIHYVYSIFYYIIIFVYLRIHFNIFISVILIIIL